MDVLWLTKPSSQKTLLLKNLLENTMPDFLLIGRWVTHGDRLVPLCLGFSVGRGSDAGPGLWVSVTHKTCSDLWTHTVIFG